MRKELINTLFILALNIITILFLAYENVFSNTIAVGSAYITYNTILAIIFFIVLVVVKSNLRVALITNISRLSFERTITLFVFVFFYISFISVFIFTQQLTFIIGVALITFEIIFILSMLLISANSLPVSLNNKYVKLKEILFVVLVMDLILKNQPFELFSVPMDTILISAYTTLSAYIIYKLILILKEHY